MDQHLAVLQMSQPDFTLFFQQTPFKGQRLRGRYVKKSVNNFFLLYFFKESDMQTFAVEFDTGADIVSISFPVLFKISVKFVYDLKQGKS